MDSKIAPLPDDGNAGSASNPKTNETAPELPSSKPGSLNLDRFRLAENDYEKTSGKKLLTVIPVRRPSKESWFRAHPDAGYQFPARVIELKEQNELYLVDRDIWMELDGESTFVSKLLVPIVTRQQALILWPISLPNSSGHNNDWSSSALEAVEAAKEKWVRLSPNRSLGAYDVIIGPEPQASVIWPDKEMTEFIEIAFKGRVIDTLDHPVIKQLQGIV